MVLDNGGGIRLDRMWIKADKDLFEKWRLLGSCIMGLSSIVQNDMDVSKTQVKGWIEAARLLEREYEQLIEATLHHVDYIEEGIDANKNSVG